MSFIRRYLSDRAYLRKFINLIADELTFTIMVELEQHVLKDRVLTRNEMGTFPKDVWTEAKTLAKIFIMKLDHRKPLLPQLEKLYPFFSPDEYAPHFRVEDISSIYED